MFEKMKANILFNILLKRHDINKAYAMVDENDSWYDTIAKVHNSLKEIQTLPSIQAGVKEEVVLVSNSLYSDSIYTCQDETNQNSFGHTQPAILFNFNENIYTKNITRSNGSFIHNLSTNKLKVQQIRAP